MVSRGFGSKGAYIAAGLLLLGAIALLWIWTKTPPLIARLLPECDAVVYVNLKPVRSITRWDKSPVSRTPEYQRFVDGTGIVPERDLDAVALAFHKMDDPRGPNGPVAYSEVFEGRFDPERLRRYLSSLALQQESYAGRTIYVIPVGEIQGSGGRRLRVAIVGRDRVMASNAPTTEQLHAMLDRSGDGSGPSILAARYGEVPRLSSAWGVGELGLPFAEDGFIALGGLRLPLPAETTLVSSVRYAGDIQVRIEALVGTAAAADHISRELVSLGALAKAVAQSQPGWSGSPASRVAESVAITSKSDRVVVTAQIPADLLRRLTATAREAPR